MTRAGLSTQPRSLNSAMMPVVVRVTLAGALLGVLWNLIARPLEEQAASARDRVAIEQSLVHNATRGAISRAALHEHSDHLEATRAALAGVLSLAPSVESMPSAIRAKATGAGVEVRTIDRLGVGEYSARVEGPFSKVSGFLASVSRGWDPVSVESFRMTAVEKSGDATRAGWVGCEIRIRRLVLSAGAIATGEVMP
ncbi:MAG: hypothetical protein AB7Q00_09515 [Phycisphaerales bacterium]|nr:MAG: hypothetical protein IPK69_02090 [Phycisphaerales bacterium]